MDCVAIAGGLATWRTAVPCVSSRRRAREAPRFACSWSTRLQPGPIGRGVAWLFGEEPDQQIHEDLHRFKQLMETGEIPVSEGPGLWRRGAARRRARTRFGPSRG